MRIRRLALVVLIGCTAWRPAVHSQARDQGAQVKGGRIVGYVTAADTGRPIMRAQVALIRISETRPSSFALTNDIGLYSFEQVAEDATPSSPTSPALTSKLFTDVPHPKRRRKS